MPEPTPAELQRVIGLGGAVMMGLGSIVGTGVFVSIGLAAGIAGPAVVLAIAMAALVATCNALSSAQLAANWPISGGTYEYGYRYLRPWLGFTAGWMFLCAKTASAATAALGFAGYWTQFVDRPDVAAGPIAVVVVILLTVLVAAGVRWSSRVNIGIVSLTLLSLICLIFAGIAQANVSSREYFVPFFVSEQGDESAHMFGLLHATALMFVAFTGYGRIATLGEEVRDPRRNIPRAIVLTLAISTVLYLAVAIVAVSTSGASDLYAVTLDTAAPLELTARRLGWPGLPTLVALGAMAAMLGVLLNLILGLSRVALGMSRRGDLPQGLSRLNLRNASPWLAVIGTGLAIALLAMISSVRTTWSFSAFTVLIYYSITNLAALRLPAEQRLYSPLFAWCGLIACLGLAFWIEWQIWLTGVGLILAGIAWHAIARRRRGPSAEG